MVFPATRVPRSAAALLGGVVDYAGLFPPAALSMADAAADYTTARNGTEAWMLGRFVVPAGRLPELAGVLEALRATHAIWHLSAIVSDHATDEWDTIHAFNASLGHTRAVVDAIECRPQAMAGLDWLAEHAAGMEAYVEVAPQARDLEAWIDHVKARGLRAKIRTGGITAAAFPPPAAVAGFLAAAVRAQVPFKATAGLHHALRGEYRLTYEPDAAQAPMYGYLNVLVATAALRAGHPATVAEEILQQSDESSLTWTDEHLTWHGLVFPTALLQHTRAELLVGFGSCSFREPAAEMRALVSVSR